jgi:TonB family protein
VLAKIQPGNSAIVKNPKTTSTRPTTAEPPTKCPPLVTQKAEPRYTEEARINKVTGTVTLSALFKETGEIMDITVINSLPDGLTEKAIEAARVIKFLSPIANGRKIPCRVTLDFEFNLY